MNIKTFKNQKKQVLNIDEKDRSIMAILANNARSSIAEIVHKSEIPRDTVAYRLRRLEDSGLIMHYHTIFDPNILGYNYFSIVLIKLEPVPESELTEFQEKLVKIPNITHINRTLGSIDMLLYVVTRDASEYSQIIDQIKNTPKKIIANIETLNIINELKIDDFSGLLKN